METPNMTSKGSSGSPLPAKAPRTRKSTIAGSRWQKAVGKSKDSGVKLCLLGRNPSFTMYICDSGQGWEPNALNLSFTLCKMDIIIVVIS